jgi:hypothetical protein
MKFNNLEIVPDYEVNDWLCNNIPNITPEQEDALMELIESRGNCPYYFYKKNMNKSTPLMRLTIFLIIPFTIILMLGMPFNYFLTGQFRYNEGKLMDFYQKWIYAVFQ